jgi:NADPH:quinone reductase-like Zn-dependent oxidoreductase
MATIALQLSSYGPLVESGTLAAPVEATYTLSDYREAIGHAARSNRHGKVLFAFQ